MRVFSVWAYVLKIKIENFYVISPTHIKIFAHITEDVLFANSWGILKKYFSCFRNESERAGVWGSREEESETA